MWILTKVLEARGPIVDRSCAVRPQLVVVTARGGHVVESPGRVDMSSDVLPSATDLSPSAHRSSAGTGDVSERLVHLGRGEASQANPVRVGTGILNGQRIQVRSTAHSCLTQRR